MQVLHGHKIHFFYTTFGVQLWNVLNNRYNEIVCYGASGGTAPSALLSNIGTENGGNGVVIKSYAYLKSLDILSIVVGQQGGSFHVLKTLGNIAIAGDGGGGSFVYNKELLYCAGAGGSGSYTGGNSVYHNPPACHSRRKWRFLFYHNWGCSL